LHQIKEKKKENQILVEDELVLNEGYELEQKAGFLADFVFQIVLEDMADGNKKNFYHPFLMYFFIKFISEFS
jgi:hypothetical protein